MALPLSKHIPLELIQEATKNFHQDNLISEGGGLGPAYKGRILHSGKWLNIAARRLDRSYALGDLEFLTEVSVLFDLSQRNIVSLIGFCDEKGEKIIVTSYAAKGSLSRFLHSPSLTWRQRLSISVGVASALCYLHSDEERDYAVIHRNINSYTILLDENWEPKLSGFEISIKQLVNRFGKVIVSEAIGMEEYMDPAIEKMGGVTYKGDIYSFGVVLFEILCGRLAFNPNEPSVFLAPLARSHYENATLQDIIHPCLLDRMSPQSLVKYAKVAYSCTEEEPGRRPDIRHILIQLSEAFDIQLESENTVTIAEPKLGLSSTRLLEILNAGSSKLEESSKHKEASELRLMHEILVKHQHLKISLADIEAATECFSERYIFPPSKFMESYNVYKTDFHHFDKVNPSTVVIKRLREGRSADVFIKDIQILTRFKHDNIVNLVGFCVEGSEKIIVLENFHVHLVDYMEDVENRRNLTWEKRLKICIDVGNALHYLQSQMENQEMIIEWKITSENIALHENFRAKILNIEFSESVPPNQEQSLYPTSILAKVVPSFVDVLFKMLCGMLDYKELMFTKRGNINERMLKDKMDPIIRDEISENTSIVTRGPHKDSLDTFIEVVCKCVEEAEEKLPTMKAVISELEKALFFQRKKDKQVMSLEDIKLATRNFHEENYIGGGGFGKVYIGTLKDGDGFNTTVAKRLFGKGKEQFLTELEILSEYRHENIIGLVGYCDEKDEKIIVYEHASRSSLDRYLNHASLTWLKRLNICIEVASALNYLHEGTRKQAKVVHRDIKTANILLNLDWKAKLADFGLSLISTITNNVDYVLDHACGTPGYVDPLYVESKFLTIESDVYSFGVVLFEILCGRSTYTFYKQEGQHLADFVKKRFEEGKQDEVVFEQIRDQIVPMSLTTFQEIAYRCLNHEREKRPKTKEVLKELKKALEYQQMYRSFLKGKQM